MAVADPRDRRLSPAERTGPARTHPNRQPLSPPLAYTSQAFVDLEVERVFAANWAAVGLAPSLPNPGDARPLWIFGIPIVTVRDANALPGRIPA